MSKQRSYYTCSVCGQSANKPIQRCPACGNWRSFLPTGNFPHHRRIVDANDSGPVRLTEIASRSVTRISTGCKETDHVLGGGLCVGQSILLAAAPGSGKSTLASILAHNFAQNNGIVLYVAGEESQEQVKSRCERIGAIHPRVMIVTSPRIDDIVQQINSLHPQMVIVDSIQAVIDDTQHSSPGDAAQIRVCAKRLLMACSDISAISIIIGHITKDEDIAGPKYIEHAVDTVLRLEGDRTSPYRYLVVPKNRFGPAHHTGVYEFTERGGLQPASINALAKGMLENRTQGLCGSSFAILHVGNRLSVVEIQALVDTSNNSSKRVITGVPPARVGIVLGILSKYVRFDWRGGLHVAVTGGLQISDPNVDVPLAIAIMSSYLGIPVAKDLVCCGEIALTGAIARQQPNHITEAERLSREVGFTRLVGLRESNIVEVLEACNMHK
jgi:DNA repair protein RadA/Sms